MRTGKLPEHTFKRSVLNPIQYRKKETSFRAGIGHDGAVIGNMVTAMASTAFCYEGNELYALDNALNNVIAVGGKPYGVSVAILMPEHSEEVTLRAITARICKQAAKYEVDVFAGHTELIPSVVSPTITITAYGNVIWKNQHKKVCENMDVVMTKWTGIYGGSILAKLKEEELRTKYPASYLEVAQSYEQYTSLLPEQKVLAQIEQERSGIIMAAHDVSNGGVFGALWQMLAACNVGGVFDVRKLSMKQEIIEVCEFFDLNPYMMNGQGSLLLVTTDGEYVVEKMRQAGIHAEVIGNTTKELDRKVMVGEEERFLVPPKGDALNGVFYGQPIPCQNND